MILDINSAKKLIDSKRWRTSIALTSVPGDPIHPRHISCLQGIRSVASKLDWLMPEMLVICVVNDDQFLINKKGYALIPQMDRCEIIDNIKNGPDITIPFSPLDSSDSTVCEAIEILKPDVFFKGGDRIADSTLPEWNVCQEVGCQIIDRVGADKVWSSSNYVKNLLTQLNKS